MAYEEYSLPKMLPFVSHWVTCNAAFILAHHLLLCSKFKFVATIEGLHNMVRTNVHTSLQNLLVSFCTAWYVEKF